MSLSLHALCYLHAFDNKLPVEQGFAYEDKLRTYTLDYSIQSLARIDDFLDQVRADGKLSQETYLDDPSVQYLLYFLNFYVGEVIGRALRSHPRWYSYEEACEGEPLEAFGGRIFEHSATLAFPNHPRVGDKTFRPLVSIIDRLFATPCEKSVLFSAGIMLPRELTASAIAQRPLPPPPIAAWPIDFAKMYDEHPGLFETLLPAVPAWANSSMDYLVNNLADLLRGGKVVLGAVVRANNLMFEETVDEGAPGDIIYDPRGRLSPEDLAELSPIVFRSAESLEGDFSAWRFTKHMSDEMDRACGIDVPLAVVPYPIKLSTTFFWRKHLPNQKICGRVLPVLISDAFPGAALPLPGVFWTESLLKTWNAKAVSPASILEAAASPRYYTPPPELAHLSPASLTEEGFLWHQEKNFERARAAWETPAKQNNAAALYGLGMLHENGEGIAKDIERAKIYYELAAERGYNKAREALIRLGGKPAPAPKTEKAQARIPKELQEAWAESAQQLLDQAHTMDELLDALEKAGCPAPMAAKIATKARATLKSSYYRKGGTLLAIAVALFAIAIYQNGHQHQDFAFFCFIGGGIAGGVGLVRLIKGKHGIA